MYLTTSRKQVSTVLKYSNKNVLKGTCTLVRYYLINVFTVIIATAFLLDNRVMNGINGNFFLGSVVNDHAKKDYEIVEN